MSDLLQKLEGIKIRFEEVAQFIVDPSIIADMPRYVQLNKEYKDLNIIVEAYEKYKNTLDNIESAREVMSSDEDADFKEMAKMEFEELTPQIEVMEEEIKTLLIPKDPNDDKNVIIELRSGTGGDEACIFVEDIYRMYTMYFKDKGWSVNVVSSSEGSVSGYKEVQFEVSGEEVYGTLKFESGVHRVQRVPDTESQGRVHTSAITVAVMPEAEDIDFTLNMGDVRKDTYRASGAGGQHVNKTESAVRLTHIPTNTVVECQDGRSQHKNYDKALKVLRTRLFQVEVEKQEKERAILRKSKVSTGDRSAKIRTYNYPQGRITDHRINKTMYNLSNFMNGDVQEMIDALRMAENAEKLQEGNV
jgi:peptide chain release factor 1